MEARARAIGLRSSDVWETTVADALRTWLVDFDAQTAIQHLYYSYKSSGSIESSSVWAKVRRFYSGLFVALICCPEARNLHALQRAEEVASEALRHLDDNFWKDEGVRQFFDHPSVFQSHFPPPWTILWFRAIAKTSLGRASAARADWQDAYTRALKAAKSPDDDISEDSPLASLAVLEIGGSLFPIVARFLHDLAVFCFSQGDWGWNPEAHEYIRGGYGARAFFDAARNIVNSQADPNPYILAGRASFCSYVRMEYEAILDIEKAYNTLEEKREGRPIKADGFYSTGRVYFHAGLLAYKYLHRDLLIREGGSNRSPDDRRLGKFERAVEELKVRSEELGDMFESIPGANELFSRAAKSYLAMKVPFRALPALIMMTDPLKKSDDPSMNASRSLLWDFIYGFGSDFVESLVHYENLVAQYFATDLLANRGEVSIDLF